MRTRLKTLATALALALIGGCMPALAAVPLRWTVETSRAQPARYDVYRGETLQLTADLTSYGQPVSMAGTAALYIQTNGMGNAWWTIPATVSSNRIDATLSPSSYPATATTLNCFMGGPATSYRAAFVLRILGAPGPAPNTVEPPVVTLDFDAITVLNAPYWTRDEADARYGGSSTATVVTNIAAAVVARDALPKSNGVAENLTVGGEFRLDDGAGNYGTIQYRWNNDTDYTEWWAGVPGFWLGAYRLRNPGSGNTATIAFTSDLPDLAPYTEAAAVASNALPRAEASQTYATQTALGGKLDAESGTATNLEIGSMRLGQYGDLFEYRITFDDTSYSTYLAMPGCAWSLGLVLPTYETPSEPEWTWEERRVLASRPWTSATCASKSDMSALSANVWAISNRVDALETAVGTANALLQSALNGGSQQ